MKKFEIWTWEEHKGEVHGAPVGIEFDVKNSKELASAVLKTVAEVDPCGMFYEVEDVKSSCLAAGYVLYAIDDEDDEEEVEEVESIEVARWAADEDD